MLGTAVYPITIAEMNSYSTDADRLFKGEEHEHLKEFLALHPERGDVIAGTNGVRQLQWPIGLREGQNEAQVIYYFRDLNIPLYLLAIFPQGEWVEFDDGFRLCLGKLVDELIVEHSRHWAQFIKRPDSSA